MKQSKWVYFRLRFILSSCCLFPWHSELHQKVCPLIWDTLESLNPSVQVTGQGVSGHTNSSATFRGQNVIQPAVYAHLWPLRRMASCPTCPCHSWDYNTRKFWAKKNTGHAKTWRGTAEYILPQQKQSLNYLQINPNVTQTKQNTQKSKQKPLPAFIFSQLYNSISRFFSLRFYS